MKVHGYRQGEQGHGSGRDAHRPSCSPRWATTTRSWSRPASCWPAKACILSSKGKRVAIHRQGAAVIDGPFAETKELIAGFWIWQVKSMDEAVEWVKRCPMLQRRIVLEIRPVFEAEDFGEAFTPELRAQEERIMARSPETRQEVKQTANWSAADSCRGPDLRGWSMQLETLQRMSRRWCDRASCPMFIMRSTPSGGSSRRSSSPA